MVVTAKKGTIEKIGDVLFFVAFGLFLVSEILMTSAYAQYISVILLREIRYTWLGILVIREFFMPKEYNIPTLIRLLFHNVRNLKWLLALAAVLALTIYFKFDTNNNMALFVLIFVLCARNFHFDQIAKFAFIVTLCTVALVIISSYIGIIASYSTVEGTRSREFLGFLYCLYPSMYLFNLTLLYLYIRKQSITWIELGVMVIISVWMFIQTISRLSFILSILAILVFAFLKIKPEFLKGKRFLCGVLVLSFVICFALSLILALLYSDSSSLMVQLNSFLNHRLRQAHKFILNSGIHFGGRELYMVGSGLNAFGEKSQGTYAYVDCFYIQFLLRNGIVFTIVWFALLTITMYLVYRAGNYPLLVCLVFVALGWMVDDLQGRLYFNTFWLAECWVLQRFMSQHEEKPKLFPGEDGKLVSGLNWLFSWKSLEVKDKKPSN